MKKKTERAETSNTRLEVLKLKLKGFQPRQIADQLDLRVVTVHTYIREIERQIADQNISELSESGLNILKTTIGELMPYMGVALSDTEKKVKQLNNLHTDVIETGEFTILCLRRLLEIEMDKEVPDIEMLQKTTSLLDTVNKTFFNKEGIQIVNVLNDNTVNIEAEKRAESLKALQKMAGLGEQENIVEAEIDE